ncbi:MAG: uroporphyrinogen-III synthase [Deltaproteobacteria bacterium]|nr:uroporphyrinogen-III synthase [Deltaproteobacteria bacterium]
MKVVVFKEAKEFSRAQSQLKPLQVLKCPAISIREKKMAALTGEFDFLLVTSANALRFVRNRPKVKTVVAIGAETSASIRLKSGEKLKVLKESHAGGVLKFFKSKKSARILYLRGSLSRRLGDKRLVPGLKKWGHSLKIVETYQTRILNIRSPLLKILKAKSPEFLFLTSPSMVEAFRKSFTLKEMRSFKTQWIAIGPTTLKAAKRLKIKALIPPQASLKAMKKLALRS